MLQNEKQANTWSTAAWRWSSLGAALLILTPGLAAQYTPLISGGAGFFTSTNAGATSYLPIVEPLAAVPIGKRLLVESRSFLLESAFPDGKGGYGTNYVAGLTYLQGDFILTPHITLVVGDFLIPFNSYNERLSPLWINNFQDGPLIAGLGTMATASGTGAQLRGSAIERRKYQVAYAGYFSSRVGNQYFAASRAYGGRLSAYLPEQRVEVGLSYGRSLQGTQENFYGMYVWYEPKNTSFRLRSEFARGHHAQGYWIEADYRTRRFHGVNSLIGRFEPLLRMQQTWRRDTVVSDSVPLVNTERLDLGLNYNLPHSTRLLTSYSRQFSDTGSHNIWETGITYRFIFPAWKGNIQ